MKQRVKVGVLGIGAIGTVLSSILYSDPDIDLILYNRTPKSNLKLIFNKKSSTLPIKAHSEIIDNQELDWLIICIKEHQFLTSDMWLEKLVNSNTKVAVIRNGINLKEPILKYTSEEKIVECMIDCPTQPNESDYYVQMKKPKITVSNDRISIEFQQLFDDKDIDIISSKDFKSENWKKLCESASLGSILCLSGETCWVFRDSEIQRLYKNILKEAILVARADGAIIEEGFIENSLKVVMNYPEDKGSSMLTDRNKGSQIELGAKNGIISELGKRHNVRTPLNDFITAILSKTNNSH